MTPEDDSLIHKFLHNVDEERKNRMDWRAMAEKFAEIFSRQYPESIDSYNLDLSVKCRHLYCRLYIGNPESGEWLYLQPPVTELDTDNQHRFLKGLLDGSQPTDFEINEELETASELREKGEHGGADTILDLLTYLVGEVPCSVTINLDRQMQALMNTHACRAMDLADCKVELDVTVGDRTFICSGSFPHSAREEEKLLFKHLRLFDIPELSELWDAGQKNIQRKAECS